MNIETELEIMMETYPLIQNAEKSYKAFLSMSEDDRRENFESLHKEYWSLYETWIESIGYSMMLEVLAEIKDNPYSNAYNLYNSLGCLERRLNCYDTLLKLHSGA